MPLQLECCQTWIDYPTEGNPTKCTICGSTFHSGTKAADLGIHDKAKALYKEGICSTWAESYYFLVDMGECDESDIPSQYVR